MADDVLKKEVDCWRAYFLDSKFNGSLKFIPEKYRKKLVNYFMSIPYGSFTNPNTEWENCLSALLQSIGDKES